jgi:hypothetical protein
MNMRSPIVAILWENWRLTRVEAAWRLALGLVAGSAALTFLDGSATKAFWVLLVLHGMVVWLSILKLNGGRFVDGYKPGFPFYLLYSKPVPTATFVGVTMAYDALTCAALYVVSAALLELAFGQPLPSIAMVPWIIAFHLCYTCAQWSAPDRAVQWVGSIAFALPLYLLLKNRIASPLQVQFSPAENVLMVLVGVIAFALTVAGVARQRRGGTASAAETEKSGGYAGWLVNLFRLPCPTASATRAQVWFELKSSGLPVLAIGLGIAMLILLLFAIGIFIAPIRNFALGIPLVIALPTLLFLGGNAFGIRRRQGRTYLSAFEAMQPYGTAELAGLKVLVRAVCLLVAMAGVAASMWISTSLISAWGVWVMEGKDLVPGLLKMRSEVGNALGGLPEYIPAAIIVLASIAVIIVVASLAAFTALRARYSRRVNIAAALLLLYCLALVLLRWATRRGIAAEFLLNDIVRVMGWTAAMAVVGTTLYLFWSGFAKRALTLRYVCGVVAICAAFGMACLPMKSVGVEAMLAAWLAPLMICFLAPWALNRIRHM